VNLQLSFVCTAFKNHNNLCKYEDNLIVQKLVYKILIAAMYDLAVYRKSAKVTLAEEYIL
jgi:hypothetical protein